VNCHAYEDAWVPGMLAGKTMEEAGADNYKGDLPGEFSAREYFWQINQFRALRAHDIADRLLGLTGRQPPSGRRPKPV